jgi:hypothetical protein
MTRPTFLQDKDMTFYQGLTAEVADMFFREVEFRVIDRDKTVVDPQYTESKNIKYKSFVVRCQMDIKPKITKLTKFGIDEARDMMITVEPIMFTRGDENYPNGFPIPSEGDVVVITGDAYEIMDSQEVDYWWHTENAFTYMFTLNRLRDRSINDETLIDPANPAGPTKVPTYADKLTPYPGEQD